MPQVYVWYSPIDGRCELWEGNPMDQVDKFEPGESILMIPPIGWDCE